MGSGSGARSRAGARIYRGRLLHEGSKSKNKNLLDYQLSLADSNFHYWELYDKNGDLLAVSWFDKAGVQRTAVDRGILEEKDRLEGILVVVLTGDSI